MSDKENFSEHEAIGDPAPIEVSVGRKILKGMATAMVVTVGGFLAFAVMVTPTRCRGASRSSKLLWQQRQKEIVRAIDASRPSVEQTRSATPEGEQLDPH